MTKTKRMYLKAEAILKYLLEKSDNIDTLISCKPNDITLITTDQNLYEALGSLQAEDRYNTRKLVKFLEVVDVVSYKEKTMKQSRPILVDKRVEELRAKAMLGDLGGTTNDG